MTSDSRIPGASNRVYVGIRMDKQPLKAKVIDNCPSRNIRQRFSVFRLTMFMLSEPLEQTAGYPPTRRERQLIRFR